MPGFMSILNSMMIAMEAEDITNEVQSETNKAIGKADENRDISQTDNIFGDNKKRANSQNESEEKEENISDNSDDNSDDNSSDVESNEDNNDLTNDSETSMEEIPEEDSSEPSNEIQLKQKLMDNMITMHNIIENNINLLAEFSPEISNHESSKILYNISSNLSDCKNILYKEITENFGNKSYTQLLKSYVAINRVFDLCAEMLSKHFDNIELLQRKDKKKRKK